MTRRKWISSGLLVALLASVVAVSPFAWRAGVLFWTKHSARRIFNEFTPEARRNLNTTPKLIVLPDFKPDGQNVETATIGDYTVRFPQPTTPQADPKLGDILLTYPRFQVRIRSPFSTAGADSVARQLNYRDFFEERSVINHPRLDDLDAQRDIPSLQRFLLLIAMKPNGAACVEEFDRGDLRGFIDSPAAGGKRTTVVEIYIPPAHAGCGVWFKHSGELTMDDIHNFLAVLHFATK